MKMLVLSILLFLSQGVQARDRELGTTRSEDLQIKARMEYERRNQKKPQASAATPQNQTTMPKIPEGAGSGFVMPATTAVSQKGVMCKNGGELRELYIEYKGQGCELFYIKLGQAKSQARQSNGKSVCETVYEQMKTTIEKTGFVCEPKAN